ncbi:MAG TPA: class I SAM-dependent methyltransferase [Sphingomonas sp.]|uniref:class I SAM-dependent methyltransferase n=1 Tax=Sphingomonas sp. TaxID=28214 RepID=UPI002C8EF442|nr:class I SAM-dependent methyltransferase [Sphingomonas sp.]HMI18111.1 class I SAM-dependent methyltransferase [Sphingomonas sp.]
MSGRENYGIHAPTVVRNLGSIGAILLSSSVLSRHWHILEWLAPTMVFVGLSMVAMSLWMLISSLWLKRFVLRRLLDAHRWRGDEIVLDLGCGRGLVAIGAARRVPSGKVLAIDLWQDVDLSGNTPEALTANAQAAGVADRVRVETGDARSLPYPDASFDVVASMTVIHNIPDEPGRAAAVAEAWRVTKPGGQILIFDIRHARAYLRQLRGLGATEVALSWPILLWGMLGWRFAVTKP